MHAQTLLCGIPLTSVRGLLETPCDTRTACSTRAGVRAVLRGRTQKDVCVATCVSASAEQPRGSATSGCIISLSGVVTWHVAAFPAELCQGGGCLREHLTRIGRSSRDVSCDA